jgi:hypothetical protein
MAQHSVWSVGVIAHQIGDRRIMESPLNITGSSIR